MNGPEHLEILEPLGADQGTFAARDTATGTAQLVVVERVTRASPVPAARAELLRRGRALKALEHPKVVRVRDVFERDAEVLVVSDYVDGEWLSSLMMMQPRPPLGVMLRIVIDVLEGLGALHGLRDERDHSVGFVHGALGPDTVLVAADGVAEIARACRLPRPGTNERYVAPELRRGDGPADVGGDIYAAGSILRDIVADAPSDATWAEPLTDIAWRACAVDPETRWPSALAMATTVRRVAGSRLATAAAVAEFMRRQFGDKMHGRRAALEALDEPGAPSSEPVSLKPSDLELLDPSSAPTLVGKLPPLVATLQPPPVQPAAPAPREVPVARVTLAKKPALILETQDMQQPPELPEAATKRRPTVNPPPAASVTPPPQAQPQKSLPPPTIRPEEVAAPMPEAYRRQMPTFPTFDEGPPPRRGVALQGLVIAGAIALTFVLGWWVGRTYGQPADTARAVCPSATTLAATPATPPAITTASSAPAVTGSVAIPEVVSATPVASASAPPSPAPTVIPTTPAWAMATPTAHAPPAPPAVSTAVAPKPAPTTAPKPSATHGGFVPEEL
jgi:serine/threonine protein kinase